MVMTRSTLTVWLSVTFAGSNTISLRPRSTKISSSFGDYTLFSSGDQLPPTGCVMFTKHQARGRCILIRTNCIVSPPSSIDWLSRTQYWLVITKVVCIELTQPRPVFYADQETNQQNQCDSAKHSIPMLKYMSSTMVSVTTKCCVCVWPTFLVIDT